jgi:acetoin utilization deacetylase AcuC-like enzyme
MAAAALYFFLYAFLLVTFLQGAQALASAFPVFFDSNNHLHRDLRYHPEQPLRISLCVEALDKFRGDNPNNLLELIDVTTGAPTLIEGVHTIHQPFTEEELSHARDMLIQAHTDDLVTQLEERSRKSREQRMRDGKPALGHMGNIDADTYVTTESFNVCLRATAAWIRAVDVAETNDSGTAMALTRPPGHHAEKGASNGFCIYNFAAAAALHALQDPNKRVSILDWDVHFGQGVKDILMPNSRARYVSIHQTPAFPYMGEYLQTHGEHKNVLTIPMPAETTWTCGYKDLFDKALDFVCNDEWQPDIVIVCAGYDALDSDELASVSLNAQDFGRMTLRLSEHLGETTSKRPAVIFGLEGGYQLSKMAGGGGLQDAVVETVRALTM